MEVSKTIKEGVIGVLEVEERMLNLMVHEHCVTDGALNWCDTGW